MDGTLPPVRDLQPILVLNEVPCPYLEGYWERKLLLVLDGPEAQRRHDELTRGGFRRSQRYIYRPACRRCDACVPARVPVREFSLSRGQRRTWKRNEDLRGVPRAPLVTQEQFDLFQHYLQARHGDGEMANMNERDFAEMVGASPVDTCLVEFRDEKGRMVAGLLCDRMTDGLSLVYSFFDPREEKRGLGNYMILWAIEEAARLGLPFVYLGYWIEGSPKMAYKSAFKPLEVLRKRSWQRL
ncbi:MAG: arginyltransferase [Limibacillus sp.]|jgi:arginyl-tRNA--protein-N-Asp/Glu arginylyltransferase